MRRYLVVSGVMAVLIAAMTAGTLAQVGFKATTVLQAGTTVTGQDLQFPLFRNQITAAVLEIAPSGEVGRHRHPVPTFVYVLEGSVQVAIDGQSQTSTYGPGQAYLEAVNTWHNVYNRGTGPARLLVVFAGEQGQPNLVRP